MKEMKRILALVLCFVMLVGLVPPAEALIPKSAGTLTSGNFMRVSGDVIDAAIFCSDVHGHPDTVTSVFNGIKSMDATFNPTTAAFVGDTQTTASSVTSVAQGVFPGVSCYYAFGNHDDENGNTSIPNVTGLLYGDSTTNYYIYAISESSMGSSNPDTTGFTSTVAGLDKTKPLFIISHLPLHSRRGDSYGAPAWYAAISAAAKEMDIFFFWAHNHTWEEEVDQAAYYVPNDGTESMIIEYSDGEPVYPEFTYANAGYINPPNEPARNNVATAVYIYSNRVDLVVCNEDGMLTGSYAVDVSVDRLHAASQPQVTTPVVDRIKAVSNKDVYYVGDKLDLTVYEVYTNGDEVAVEGYTTSGFDSNVLGAQTVIVSYNGFSTTVSVNVVEQDAEPVLTGIQVTYSKQSLLGENLTLKVVATYDNGTSVELTEGEYTVEGYDPAVTGAQGVIVTYKTQSYGFNVISTNEVTVVADGMGSLTVTDVTETLTDALAEKLEAGFVAYDIVPNAYNVAKNVAVVSMPAPEGANAVYYWNEETQTLEPVSDFTFENGKVVFTTDHFSPYVVGTSDNEIEIEVPNPETATGSGSTTTTTTKTVYVLTSSIAADNEYLIANSGSASTTTRYLLTNNNGSVAATGVTIKSGDVDGDGDTETYIELDNAANSLWTTSGNSSTTLKNGSHYLYMSGSNNNYSLSLSTTNSTTWTYSSNNNRLTANYYRLRYNDGWTLSYNSGNVYFYVPTEIKTETETEAEGIYSIEGMDISQVVVAGNADTLTAELTAELTFTSDAGVVSEPELVEATFTVVEGGDPNAIIDKIENGQVHFTGKYGKALIKISYDTNGDAEGGIVTNYIIVEALEPYYTLEIEQGDTYTHKGVQAGQTLDLNAVVTVFDGEGEFPVDDAVLTWTIESGKSIANIAADTGILTFTGAEGDIHVKVEHVVDGNTTLVDFITVHVHKSTAITPEESTTDFPRWPNPGAVRFDKTAQAVGNFSNTGVAQMELSMAGIPVGGAVDVYLMVDMSSSVNKAGLVTVAKNAAVLFAQEITDNGTNDNRIAVGYFNSSSNHPTIFDFDEYETLLANNGWSYIESQINTMSYSQGTYYDEALEEVYSVLSERSSDNPVYLVFISDGAPNTFRWIDDDTVLSDKTTATVTQTTSQPDESHISSNKLHEKTEFWTHKMKEELDVGVFTIGLNLDSDDDQYALALLQNMSSDAETNYANVPNGTTSEIKTSLEEVLKRFATSIKAAATNIEVTDKVSDSYEMIFDWPEAINAEHKVAGQEFYIEVVNYDLNSTTNERTGTYDVLTRLYLGKNDDGTLTISSLIKIENGTTTPLSQTPVYTAVGEGEKGFFNLVDGNYVYVADGTGTHKMTEGATVSGTADTVVLHTPYFSYDAATKVIKWHVSSTADHKEIALRYFLYLTNSLESAAGMIPEDDPRYVESKSYPTNDYATLEYKNFRDKEVMQYFPEPQLTWNGAQVHYVFYLVNTQGQPVNRAGRVVNFAEAVFVTDIYPEIVIWNEDKGITSLESEKIAEKLLPDEYHLYDEDTKYDINVYQNANGDTIYDYFVITGGGGTTMVYNTKAGTKYSEPGEYTSKMESMEGFDFANTTVAFAVVWEKKLTPDTVVVDFGLPVDINVTTNDFVYNSITAIGTNKPNADVNTGTYGTSTLSVKVDETNKTSAVLSIGDHSAQVRNENVIRFTPGSTEFNAPVKFYYETSTEFYEGGAVDTVFMYSEVTVIPATTIYYEDSFVEMKTYDTPVTTYTEAKDLTKFESGVTYYTKNEDDTYTKAKQFTAGVTYYTAATSYTEHDGWTTVGDAQSATQAQDRPGKGQIQETLDAENNYGYDEAYKAMSEYSLGSAAMVNVNTGKYATASFEFYGTGFDIISLTSATTGTIFIDVYKGNDKVVSEMVDTYYGYAPVAYYEVTYKFTGGKWVATNRVKLEAKGTVVPTPENPMEGDTFTTCETEWGTTVSDDSNALYQVPVMKIGDGVETKKLDYGKYKVVITVSYVSVLDPNKDAEGYNFYLDAIRIYNPAGDNQEANDAYEKDGEAAPEYFEVRNQIIAKNTFDSLNDEAISGIVFIDGGIAEPTIADYTSYGPNNETYLANGQAIAFQLNGTYTVPAGKELSTIQLAVKTVGGTGKVEVYGVDANGTVVPCLDETIATATDMYYDITALEGMTVVIKSTGTATISITNVKVTYKTQETNAVDANSLEETGEAPMLFTVSRASAAAALATMSVEEEVPETTVPEETEPETSVPEETEPEETEPETTVPEETEPEETEPSAEEQVKEVIEKISKVIRKIFGRIFG